MGESFLPMLTYLHLSPPLMLAGLCGGIVNIFYFHRTKPLEWVGAIVCGALMANFLAGLIVIFGGGETPAIGGAFLMGWFGLKWVANSVKKRFPGLLFDERKPDGTF